MSQLSTNAEAISDLASEHGFRVGAAESLTGGAVSSALAAAPGAGEWYRGGIVAYSEEVKFEVLGVEPGPLVCEPCALQMAEGAAKTLGADAVVSTTGVGGPGEQEGHPPGTVYVGVFVQGSLTCSKLELVGDPAEVVEAATTEALGLLRDAMAVAVRSGD